jgi:hypothetical protein
VQSKPFLPKEGLRLEGFWSTRNPDNLTSIIFHRFDTVFRKTGLKIEVSKKKMNPAAKNV